MILAIAIDKFKRNGGLKMRKIQKDNLIYLEDYDYSTLSDSSQEWDFYPNEYLDEIQDIDYADEVPQELDLTGVNLHGANLQKADLSNSNIIAAEMRFSELEQANFSCSLINMSDLYGSNFKNANLEYVEIRNTDLSYSNLQGANLVGALLSNSDLSCTDLRKANLKKCVTNRSKFQNAVFDENTVLPFDRKEAEKLGMIFIQGNVDNAS